MYYRIYVTLKNGNQAIGRELHEGSPPASGAVKVITAVHADEI
jgi:hypothetical protein